ncbi:MAG: hypothetical protein IJ512_06875 [Ruminococcus sp.]|nr:hypothetical protein [Ruminococcus sp.]
MINFSDLFMESKGEPVQYGEKTLLLIDQLPISQNFSILLKLISTHSEWRQAIRIAINTGSMTVDGIIKRKEFRFWEDDLRKEPNQTIIIHGKTKDRHLSVWNAYERIYNTGEKVIESWNMGAAMLKGEDGIYYCNDAHVDDDFNDLIFQIKVL